MILYNNIVKISKNRWIGYMLKVAFLLDSSIDYTLVWRTVHIKILILVCPNRIKLVYHLFAPTLQDFWQGFAGSQKVKVPAIPRG